MALNEKERKMRKLLGMVLAIVSFGLILPLTVNAACTKSGEVVRVVYASQLTTAYIKTSSLSLVSYWTTTTDNVMAAFLRHCDSGRICTVTGNAAECPADGVSGTIGTATKVIVNP